MTSPRAGEPMEEIGNRLGYKQEVKHIGNRLGYK